MLRLRTGVHVIRFLINAGISLVGALLAFWIASMVIDGFTVSWNGILIAAVVFTVAQALLGPVVFNLARKYASAILGGIGLVSTLVALIVATLFEGGIKIEGITAWIASTVLIWLITALITWILGYFLITKWLTERNEAKDFARRAKQAKPN